MCVCILVSTPSVAWCNAATKVRRRSPVVPKFSNRPSAPLFHVLSCLDRFMVASKRTRGVPGELEKKSLAADCEAASSVLLDDLIGLGHCPKAATDSFYLHYYTDTLWDICGVGECPRVQRFGGIRSAFRPIVSLDRDERANPNLNNKEAI